MLTIKLPEPAKPIDSNPNPNCPWVRAVAARNWARRADQLDCLIVDMLAEAIARGQPMDEARGLIFLRLTAALETVCDIDIRSADAATFYCLTTHPEWRAASAEFFGRNQIGVDSAFRHRPGARLLRAIAIARAGAIGGER